MRNTVSWVPTGPTNKLPVKDYILPTNQIPKLGWKNSGNAQVVTSNNFPILQNASLASFIVEIFDESMRILHWHDCAEIGIVQSGTIEVYLWRNNEASVFVVPTGNLWFIPPGALHSLDNISSTTATLIIGFDSSTPGDFDLPMIYNGLPQTIRRAYTTPGHHAQLSRYMGPVYNPLTGFNPLSYPTKHDKNSSFKFDIIKTKPLFASSELGIVTWAVQENWPVLSQGNFSFVWNILTPGTTRDAIWYPDASVLYIVKHGVAEFTLVFPGWDSPSVLVKEHDMIFVPVATLHTFVNVRSSSRLEIVGFFNRNNPLPEVSLIAATNFFPKSISNASLLDWGNKRPKGEKPSRAQKGPLDGLKPYHSSPYLLAVTQTKTIRHKPK